MHVMNRLLAAVWLALSMVASAAAQETSLAEAEAEMENTVVTATRTAVSLRDAPGAVTVISADQIKEMTANDILDIVRETVGISLVGRGVGGRTVISIRGLESRQTLILIDGKRVPATDSLFGHSDFEQNWVPIEAIERIEVVRGPLSALYGSEAMGGVINIITKKSTSQWHGSLRAGGGVRADTNGGESQSYAAQLSGPIVKDRVGVSLAAEYIRDDGTPDPDEPNSTELEEKEVSTVSARLTFTPTDHQTLETDITLTNDDRWRDTVSKGTAYEDIYELDKTVIGLSWQGTIGPAHSIVKAYRSEIDKDSLKKYSDGRRTEYPERLTNDALDIQTSVPAGFNLITVGAEFRKERLESNSLEDGEDDVAHQALFIQDELTMFGDRLMLTPGLRWDDHESFGSEVSPRIYTVFKLNEQINLKAGYGHAFRAPTVKQVSEGYVSTSGPHIFLGNPDVKPETSDAYEAGAEYFGKKVFARILFFYNDIDNLIDYQQIESGTGALRTFVAANVDAAETKGVETEIVVTLPHGLELSAGYTYLDAMDTGNDERFDGKPRHSVNAKLAYRQPGMGFSAVLRAQHIADQVLYNDDDELENAPDYTLWHVSMRKRLLDQFELQVGVDNLTDVRLADESDLFAYEERGRFFYANLRYDF